MWNWQHRKWPDFVYKQDELDVYERQFFKHLHDDDKNTLSVDIISEEAIQTSEIEREHLNRDSV